MLSLYPQPPLSKGGAPTGAGGFCLIAPFRPTESLHHRALPGGPPPFGKGGFWHYNPDIRSQMPFSQPEDPARSQGTSAPATSGILASSLELT